MNAMRRPSGLNAGRDVVAATADREPARRAALEIGRCRGPRRHRRRARRRRSRRPARRSARCTLPRRPRAPASGPSEIEHARSPPGMIDRVRDLLAVRMPRRRYRRPDSRDARHTLAVAVHDPDALAALERTRVRAMPRVPVSDSSSSSDDAVQRSAPRRASRSSAARR